MERSMLATADEAHDESSVAFSRTIGVPTGGADDELKTRVSFDEGEAFRRLARELGFSTSELLRQMVRIRLYGVDGVAMMERQRLERVAGGGTEKARERTAG